MVRSRKWMTELSTKLPNKPFSAEYKKKYWLLRQVKKNKKKEAPWSWLTYCIETNMCSSWVKILLNKKDVKKIFSKSPFTNGGFYPTCTTFFLPSFLFTQHKGAIFAPF